MIGASVLATLVQGAVNQYLGLDPETRARLEGLSDKVLALDLQGLDITLYLFADAGGVTVTDRCEVEPDTRIRATPLGLAAMARPGERRTLLGEGVEIQGDTEVGQRFKAVLDAVEIDWEEQLARITGDVVAHQVGNWVRGLADYTRRTGAHFADDLGEYLTEEAGYFPPHAEVKGYLDAVDQVRDDVDRLEARIARLEAKLRSGE